MTMPDRSSTVRAYYQQHPEWFTAERHDENRRRSLPHLIALLETVHPEDAGKWGVLVKTDRNNKIPCDVLVWRDDENHVDVMDSQGGLWNPHGPIHRNAGGHGIWFWAPASVVDPNGDERALQPPPYVAQPDPGPEPDPDIPPQQPPSVDLGPVLAALAEVKGLIEQMNNKPAPSVSFPIYEGTVAMKYLPTGQVYLKPKV